MTSNLPHILILGGTGRTGKLVVQEALRRGHAVTSLVRKATNDTATPPTNLNVVVGSPCSAEDIERALSNIDPPIPVVVVSTLGQTRTSGNPFAAPTSPPLFMASSMEAVLSVAHRSSNIKKILVMSMSGAGDSFGNLNFIMRWIMLHSNMLQALEDQNTVDALVRKGRIPFVLPRPVMLKGGGSAPIKNWGDRGDGAGFMPSVTPGSVAAFLLDAAVSNAWDGTSPVITN